MLPLALAPSRRARRRRACRSPTLALSFDCRQPQMASPVLLRTSERAPRILSSFRSPCTPPEKTPPGRQPALRDCGAVAAALDRVLLQHQHGCAGPVHPHLCGRGGGQVRADPCGRMAHAQAHADRRGTALLSEGLEVMPAGSPQTARNGAWPIRASISLYDSSHGGTGGALRYAASVVSGTLTTAGCQGHVRTRGHRSHDPERVVNV